jgi:hypothetical protein
MSTTYGIQPSFARGELSPRLHARIDIDHYRLGLAECFNFIVLRQGILRRRPGTQFVNFAKSPDGAARMIPFIFSVEQSYALEFGDHSLRFYTRAGQVVKDGATYEIETPWASADLADLQYTQKGDIIFVVHKDYPPYQIERHSETDWRIVPFDFVDGPYLDITKDGTVITPNFPGSLVPYMTSNTTPFGVASSSSSATIDNLGNPIANGADAWKAFAAEGGEWQSLALGSGWLQYTFPNPTCIDGYVLMSSNQTKQASVGSTTYNVPGRFRAPRTWSIEASNDNFVTSVVLDVRSGETNWGDAERRYYSFVNKIKYKAYRINVTESNQSDTGQLGVSIAYWGLSGGEGDRLVVTLTASDTLGINDGAGFVTSDVGRHIRLLSNDVFWHWYKITEWVSPTQVKAELHSPPMVIIKGSTSWRLGAFSETSGWPARIGLFQERMFFARTNHNPQSLWGSKVGSFGDHGVSIPLKADDAISLTINDVGEIQWIGDSGDLLVGTISGVRPIGPANKNEGFSATNFQQGRRVRVGCAPIMPAPASDAFIFVGHFGNSLHELVFSFDVNGYVAPDISVLSEHLFKYGVRGMSYAQKPNAVLWTEISDGSLVGMTYEREQKTAALHRHILGGSGSVVSQCVVPGVARDELWMIVDRPNGMRTVEVMVADYESASPDTPSQDQAGAFYVDCGLTYAGAPVTTLTGLDHLEGLTVAILANGAPEPQQVVTGGSITLQEPASTVHVGLPYTSRARTLPIAHQGQDGSSLGRKKRIRKVLVNVLETAGLTVRSSTGRAEVVELRNANDAMGQAVPLYTGTLTVRVDDRWENGGVLEFEVAGPEPCTIRAITPAFESEP